MQLAQAHISTSIFASGALTSQLAIMPSGTVKKFFEDKGFGFITPDDGSEDIFVHRKCNGEDRSAYLDEGDKVEYEVEWNDQKGKYSASTCTPFKTGGGGGGGGGGGKGGGKGYSPW